MTENAPSEDSRLHWFNDLPTPEAVAQLLGVCHSRPWAEQVAARRPYAGVQALQTAADETWMSLAPQEWLRALEGHPRIGERGGASAEASVQEQAQVSAAADSVQAAIARGNREYEARFGHVFLVSAAGRSPEAILRRLQARMDNDPETEVRVAAEEHRRISRLRIERLMQA